MDVSAKVRAGASEVTFNIPFDLSMLDETAIHEHARRNIVVAIQQKLRVIMADKDIKDNQKHVESFDWVTFLTPRRKLSRVEKLAREFAEMDDSERATLIAALTSEDAA